MPLPPTQSSLLVRLRDPADRDAWVQFVDLYAPLVYKFARRRGLQDADAADLTQEVLQAVARATKRMLYAPARGSLRSWLFTVARNKLLNFLAGRKPYAEGSGDTSAQELLERQPAPDPDEAAFWDREYERRLFDWAAERVRGDFQESTWRAFWQTAVEGRPAKDVAAALGMSIGAVYIAKSRVLARLREQVAELQVE